MIPRRYRRPLLLLALAWAMPVWGAADGEALYGKYCAVCHGEAGDGRSRAAASLKPPPRDFVHADPETLTRERMLEAVREGRAGTAMMSFARRLTPEEQAAVVDYIRARFMGEGERKTAPPPSREANEREDDLGARLYQRHCAVCHGDDGRGAVWARNSLKPPPRDFVHADPETLTRERMLEAVAHGRSGTAMQPFSGRLAPREQAAVVDYIRRTFMNRGRAASPRERPAPDRYPGGLQGDPLRGEAIFQGQCFECHGRRGQGDGPRSHFIHPRPRDFTSADSRARFQRAELFRAIARGKRGTVMPAWDKVLSPQQIADVAEYVYTRFIHPRESAGPSGDGEPFAEPADPERGRRVYDFRCYFCHGYDGDARTLAASYLDPPPVAFTEADPARLTPERIVEVLRRGRPGTAMQSFARTLSPAEMRDVAAYVYRRFVVAGEPAGDYHTPENGWPDHQRYRDAFPFALGEIPLDRPVESLTPEQRRGRELYLRSCITCHDRGRVESEGPPWRARPLSYPRNGYDHRAPDQVSGASPYAVHDQAPVLPDLTAEERLGERLYQQNCAFCHAKDGSGAHWIGSFLEPSPRDLRDPALAGLSDEALLERIARGVPGSAMPAWRYVLDERQIRAVIAYLRKAFLK